MKSFIPKFSERFCDSRKIREDRDTRRYYGGAGGFTFIGSIARNGAFRDGSGKDIAVSSTPPTSATTFSAPSQPAPDAPFRQIWRIVTLHGGPQSGG